MCGTREGRRWRGWLCAVAGCLGLALVVSPALAGDARTSAVTPWVTTGNTLGSGFLGTLNSFPLIVRTNNVERLRVTPSGSVGIGTSSPVDPLSVKTATNQYGITHTDGTTTVGTWVGSGTSPATVASGWFGTRSASPLQFFTGGHGTAMTLSLNGNLGVGTPTPADKLSVQTATNKWGLTHTDGTTTVGTFVGNNYGYVGTRSNSPLRLVSGAATAMTLRPTGNVGIGTIVPDDRLSVVTATNSYGITHSDGTTTLGTWVGAGSTGLASGWLGTKTNAALRLFTNDGPAALNIYPSGEVGIGTYTQTGTSKLNVRSDASNVGAGEFVATQNWALSARGTGNGYGIYADAPSPHSAGFFGGEVTVTGDLTVLGDINGVQDHPLDAANKTLASVAVSASERLNVFSGNITTGPTGEATVQLPGYFSAAYTDPRYQLTVIGQFAQAIVAREISNNTFTIRTDKPNVKVSWQVTALRNDAWAKAHPFQAEQDKHATASAAPSPNAAPTASTTP